MGRLWRGQGGRRHAASWEEERGVLGAASSSPPFLTARVGAEGVGLDRGIIQEHGDRVWASKNSDLHSSFDLARFRLPGVRRFARKNFKFEILKISTFGDQHIGQGFQSYFCYKAGLSFAEIYNSKFGIVTVSDSKFDRSLSDVLI
jgi:hypothetical protein